MGFGGVLVNTSLASLEEENLTPEIRKTKGQKADETVRHQGLRALPHSLRLPLSI